MALPDAARVRGGLAVAYQNDLLLAWRAGTCIISAHARKLVHVGGNGKPLRRAVFAGRAMMLESPQFLAPRVWEGVGMFWRRRERETSGVRTRVSGPLAETPQDRADRSALEDIKLERDAPRGASISRIAEELGRRGEEIVELFKEVVSPAGRTVLPIRLRRGGEDVFVEVETGPWNNKTVEGVLRTVAVLRGSEHSQATFEVIGAYPVPYVVSYFRERSPAALLQLDLILCDDPRDAEASAEAFREVVGRYWGMELGYGPDELYRIEEQLLSAVGEGTGDGERPPILDALVRGYGCYAGEVLRRHATPHGSWRFGVDWGENLVVEFPDATADPIGKARAFLENGPEDSVAYYVAYAIEELDGPATG